jgi:hypothetical protein
VYENQEKKRAKAIAAAIGKAKTGTHQIAIEFEFLDEQGGITYYGPLTDAALEYTMKAIRTAGFQGDDLSDLSSLCGETPDVMLVIGPDEYEGKVTRKVKFINSMGGLAVKDALQGDDLAAFARSMKGKIINCERSGGERQRRPAAKKAPNHSGEEPSPFNEDPIPF